MSTVYRTVYRLRSTVCETFATGLTLTTAMPVPGMSTMAVPGMSMPVMSMTCMVPFMVPVMSMTCMVPFIMPGMSMPWVMAVGSCDCELTEAQSKGECDSNRNCYEKCRLFLHCVLHIGVIF